MKSERLFNEKEASTAFREQGFFIIKQGLLIESAELIIELVERMAGRLLGEVDHGNEGAKYLQLVRKNRNDAGYLFDTLTKLPAVNQVVYAPYFEQIAKTLLGSNLVLSPPSQMNLRADHPGEERFLYRWHNDFMFNFGSQNSLVFWIPLQDVDSLNGALHIIPGSHREELLIKVDDAAVNEGRSAEYFEITNIDRLLTDLGETQVRMSRGDVLVFDAKLVHRSGANNSENTRFSLQSRWFDAEAPDAIEHRYRTGIDCGRHPHQYLGINGAYGK